MKRGNFRAAIKTKMVFEGISGERKETSWQRNTPLLGINRTSIYYKGRSISQRE